MRNTKQLTIALFLGTLNATSLKQRDAPEPFESSRSFYAANSEAPVQAGFLQTEESLDLEVWDPQALQ